MKTVKVRIAVAVDKNGEWNSAGYSSSKINDRYLLDMAREDLEYGELCYWLTAELPIPEVETIAADVEKAG